MIHVLLRHRTAFFLRLREYDMNHQIHAMAQRTKVSFYSKQTPPYLMRRLDSQGDLSLIDRAEITISGSAKWQTETGRGSKMTHRLKTNCFECVKKQYKSMLKAITISGRWASTFGVCPRSTRKQCQWCAATHLARGQGSCRAPAGSVAPARSDRSGWTCPECSPHRPRRRTRSPGGHRTTRSTRLPPSCSSCYNTDTRSSSNVTHHAHLDLFRVIPTSALHDDRLSSLPIKPSPGFIATSQPPHYVFNIPISFSDYITINSLWNNDLTLHKQWTILTLCQGCCMEKNQITWTVWPFPKCHFPTPNSIWSPQKHPTGSTLI